MSSSKKILVLNAGSSSLKCSLINIDNKILQRDPLWQKQINWKATKQDIEETLISLWNGEQPVITSPSEIECIGHRIVHGGVKYKSSTLIDNQVLEDLRSLIDLAPAHEEENIMVAEVACKLFKNIPQVAVFDTAFHANIPELAKIYPGPYDWYEKLNIQRFGFHGISHQYCSKRAAEILNKDLSSLKIITCHLGNGASLCAIKNGVSQMTTMGFTPLEGLVMGTRSGSIDPGIILHLLNNKTYTSSQLTHILNNESGLKGISGITSNMQEIESLAKAENKRAQMALEIYINHLSSGIASLLPVLSGLDVLIFTGGVGQNSCVIREAVCQQLEFMGVNIDKNKNETTKNDSDISANQSSIRTFVIEAREDLGIVNECLPFVFQT